MDDKVIEKNRYDSRSNEVLKQGLFDVESKPSGASSVSQELRAPYIFFEGLLERNLMKDLDVLEICAGAGEFTAPLLRSADRVTSTDISSASLNLLKIRFPNAKALQTKIVDIESLSFEDCSFDIVVCAGGLSYGDNKIVLDEIYRVLRPSGKFICVDSLNNNPIYKFNRYLHYLRGNRSLSTLKRMPTIKFIDLLKKKFDEVDVSFFGSIIWLAPILKLCFGGLRAFNILNWFDRLVRVEGSAFKFVLLAVKK